MRTHLQAGTGRTIASGAIGIIAFAVMYYCWAKLLRHGTNPLESAQKVAFVAAAFSVTAYNLRTRVMDLILKIEGTPSRIAQLSMIARGCGRKLTNLVVLFTLTALAMGAGGYIPRDHWLAVYFAAFVAGLFGASIVQFIYVLFAFERLERFMLDDAEARAANKEAKRLLAS